MLKKGLAVVLAALGAWACATAPPPVPPAFYIPDIPPELATGLTLDDRVAAHEAWQLLRAGRAEQAGKIIARLGPGHPAYAVGLGYVHLVLADLAAAEAGFQASLREVPEMIPARVGLAQIHTARGESEEAFLQYREILKIDPEDRWAKPRFEALRGKLTRGLVEEAAKALDEGSLEAAKAALLKVLFYDPDSPDAHFELGRIAMQADDADGALLHYQAFLDQDTAGGERLKTALRDLAEIHFRREDLGQSLEYLERLRELDPSDQDALGRIEALKARLGIYELPSQYSSITDLEAIAREDLAALVGVKFKDFLAGADRRTKILVDIATSWAQNYIVEVASTDIMGVFDNHTFQPKRIINRAELAETAVRLIRFLQARGHRFVPLVEPRRIEIADVNRDNYFFQAIVEALSYQIMALNPLRMFEPDRTVSGREAARVLDVILKLAR